MNKKIFIWGSFITLLLFLAAIFGGNNSNKSSDIKEPLQSEAPLQNKKVERVEKTEVTSIHWQLTEKAEDSSTKEAVLTGIIKNTGNVPLVLEGGTGVLYGEQRKILAQTHGLFYPPIISPGELSYISFGFLDNFFEPNVVYKDIINAEIQFSSLDTRGLITIYPLEIFQESGGIKGQFEHYEINGEIKNTLERKVKNVRAYVLYYDKNENLLDVQETFANDIEPGKQVVFSITNTNFSSKIANYKLFTYAEH